MSTIMQDGGTRERRGVIFQHIMIVDIGCVNMAYSISQIIDEFFLFLAILDNNKFFILNKFFLNNNTD